MLRPRLIAALLSLLTFLVFARATQNGYVHFDDDNYLVFNAHVHQGLALPALAWAWTTVQGGNYHPVTWLAHELNWQLFGINPAGHHLASVLLHAINATLVFLLLNRMTSALWRSAIVALLFALHPLRVESVAWAAELKDVLSATFALLALWAYARYAQAPTAAQRAWRMTTVAVFLTLGLLAKPMLVTLPFVMLLLDYWPLNRMPAQGGRGFLKLALEKLPLLALAALASVVTFLVQCRAGAVAPWDYIPPGTRLAGALIGYARYLGKTFWPVDLAVLYPRPDAWPWSQTALAAALLAAITGLAIAWRKRQPAVLVGWLWFLGMLVPVIGIVQAGLQSIADRYTYLPHVGLFIALVWGISDALPSLRTRRAAAVLGGAAAICLAFFTYRQLGVWRDAYSLFLHASRVTRGNYLAYTNLGSLLGDDPARAAESLEDFRLAWLAGQRVPNTHANYGLALARAGRFDEAEFHLRHALEMDPAAINPRTNFATLLERSGRLAQAAAEYRAALGYVPANPVLHGKLAVLLARMGDWDGAITNVELALGAGTPGTPGTPGTQTTPTGPTATLSRLVEMHPQNTDLHFMLGLALEHDGDADAAARQFQIVLQRDPSYEGAAALDATLRKSKHETEVGKN